MQGDNFLLRVDVIEYQGMAYPKSATLSRHRAGRYYCGGGGTGALGGSALGADRCSGENIPAGTGTRCPAPYMHCIYAWSYMV